MGTGYDRQTGARLPYVRTDNGAALITVTGSLVNRGAWIGANSGLTSYEGIAAQIRAAMADPKVTSLVLDPDTGGGEATGAFELADLMAQANANKPVTGFVNGMAASAGYMIASGAGRIVSVPSGLTGSIGVMMLHVDRSRQLAQGPAPHPHPMRPPAGPGSTRPKSTAASGSPTAIPSRRTRSPKGPWTSATDEQAARR